MFRLGTLFKFVYEATKRTPHFGGPPSLTDTHTHTPMWIEEMKRLNCGRWVILGDAFPCFAGSTEGQELFGL